MVKHSRKTRGIFERPTGSGVWWVRWACAYGHIHREKIGPKGLARAEYEKRKVRVRSEKEQFCPTLKAARRFALFDEIAQDYLAHSRAHKRSADDDPPLVRRLLKAFGGRAGSDIGAGDVERLTARRTVQAGGIQGPTGTASSTGGIVSGGAIL